MAGGGDPTAFMPCIAHKVDAPGAWTWGGRPRLAPYEDVQRSNPEYRRATVRRAGGESILTPNQPHDPMRSQGQRDSDEWRRRGQAAAGVPRQRIRRPNGVGGAPEWVARPLKLTDFVNFVNLAI